MQTESSSKDDNSLSQIQAPVLLVSAVGSMSGSFAIAQAKKMGFRVIGVDIFPKAHLANALLVDDFLQVPACNHPDYKDCLITILKQHRVSHYLPITDFDVDFTLKNTELFRRHNTSILLETKGDLALFRDKYAMASKLIEANIKPIKTGKWREHINKIKPPCVIKPRFGRSSEDTHKILAHSSIITLKPKKNDYIIQPFIDGDIVTCDIIKQDDKHYFIPRFEHLRTTNGAGTSVETFVDDALSAIIDKFCAFFNFTGCINIEFIRNNTGYYLMDVNPRISAGIEFSNKAGYDFVSNHLRCFLKQDIEDMLSYEKVHMVRDSSINKLTF